MINVAIEGQLFPLPEEVGAQDDLVRAALAPFVPWIANAQIERKEQNGATVLTVVKRADTKGNTAYVLAALLDTPEDVNPAVALWKRLEREVNLDDPGTILEWQQAIAEAIRQGEEDIEWVRSALEKLVESSAVPATRVPLGF